MLCNRPQVGNSCAFVYNRLYSNRRCLYSGVAIYYVIILKSVVLCELYSRHNLHLVRANVRDNNPLQVDPI